MNIPDGPALRTATWVPGGLFQAVLPASLSSLRVPLCGPGPVGTAPPPVPPVCIPGTAPSLTLVSIGQFTSERQRVQVPALHLLTLTTAGPVGVRWYLIVVIIESFLITKKTKHHFTCLLTLSISSSPQYLNTFLFPVVWLFCVDWSAFFMYFGYLVFVDYIYYKHILQVIA